MKGSAYRFSASQISTFLECQRKWAWRRIAHVETPPGKGAALGTEVHSLLENYLANGVRPDHVANLQASKVACKGLHLLPAPRSDRVQLETKFYFVSQRTGFVYTGFKDVSISPGLPVEALGIDGKYPVVIDHKTTKNAKRYAKTSEDLQYDAQAVLYALDSMLAYNTESVDLVWIYYPTEGAGLAMPSKTRMHRKHALRVFREIENVAEVAADALSTGKQPLDLPANTSACNSYGGCPYRHLCTFTTSELIRSRMNASSLIASLKSRVQGTPEEPEAAPVAINPPESELPIARLETKPEVEKPAPKKRGPKATPAPVEEVTVAPLKEHISDMVQKVIPFEKELNGPEVAVSLEPARPSNPGFTLYVDCLPVVGAGNCVQASALFSKAQEKIMQVLGVPDYRLVDYGKGTPAFIAYVMEQLDGSFDVALDSRTAEGGAVLESLMSCASRVVRGLR